MSKRKKTPNLLLIWTDEQRADTLAAAGNNQIIAPNLNRLADQSTVFRRAYCTQPVCTPSRATILSGQMPHQHGCTRNNMPLPKDVPTLAEMLPNHHCAYFGKWHLGDEVVAQRGFTDWVSVEDGPYRKYYSKPEYLERFSDYHHFLKQNGFAPDARTTEGPKVFSRNFAAGLPERFTKAGFLGDRAAAFLSEYDGDQPFFLSVNFLEPHMPFFGPLNDLYQPDDLEVGAAFAQPLPDDAPLRNRLMSAKYQQHGFGGMELKDEAGWRRLRANYFGLVSLVDDAVGQILTALEHSGHHDDTLVVFTSDHGDMMGDHRMLAKCVMYEQAIRIPWLVRAPWLGQEQRLIDDPISQIDLVPTVLDLLGQPQPAQLQGTSRAGVVAGESSLADNDVVVEWNPMEFIGGAQVEGFTLEQTQAVDEQTWRTLVSPDGWKLNLCPTDRCELFNLNQDPDELHNLIDDPAQQQRVREMTARVRAWQQRMHDSAPLPAGA